MYSDNIFSFKSIIKKNYIKNIILELVVKMCFSEPLTNKYPGFLFSSMIALLFFKMSSINTFIIIIIIITTIKKCWHCKAGREQLTPY